jgi:3-hydroxyisobutyryl-CoA hydrolase
VDKVKERPKWTPETLAGVADEKVVKDFFAQDSPFLADMPELSLPGGKSAPWRNYGLPSEDEIGQMVLGSHPTSGDKGLNLEELLSRFDRLRRGKHGVKEKVLEVALRRCRVHDDPERQGCLEWIH